MVRLDEAKQYLRIDHSDDDEMVDGLIQSAVAYLAQIGVPLKEPQELPVRQAILLLVGEFYDRPEPTKSCLTTVGWLVAPYREVHL